MTPTHAGATMAGGRPWAGVSLMLEDDFLRAAYPLLAAGEVDALEWSFDVGWPPAAVPAWAGELIAAFAAAGRLLGHGVHYSALSAGTDYQQQAWLANLADEVRKRPYRHVSEHFGFASTRGFHRSAPLPVPLTDATLALGRDRLRRLAAVANVPVGLENLALAFCARDVADQGRFLDQLLAPVDGFLVLDLHNLYCQAVNFDRDPDELLATYPLHRVRELHLSGGSWGGHPDRPVRRDTHDGPVPPELFGWLPRVLGRCPNVEAVILERLGGTLAAADDEPFRADFRRIKEVVRAAG